ncbi:cytochrome c [Candidatus Nitronereus thalassa]|uniref:Cytochrome c n=1 Tax=Candidatus Nitronereus thalassa TaxID=3020898 RepID=A0ABU3K953_9BACT|nr:cytochrome c [Candidatus Nitronereus thalassa]MDT7042974.1 cytochrome c [Candidatus Nitronereus thalassa]
MMKRTLKTMVLLSMMIAFTGNLALAGSERDPLKPRVPKAERGTAKKMKSPFGDLDEAPAEIVAEGKKIFEGKGTCVNCHGKDGDGQGPAGKVLNPGPRDFTNCKFHKRRKDGELMWVVMNGSPGTGMVSMIPATISEEEGWKVLAYERSFCKK